MELKRVVSRSAKNGQADWFANFLEGAEQPGFVLGCTYENPQTKWRAEKVMWDSHSWLSSGCKCNKQVQPKVPRFQILIGIDFFRGL
jgi:hypothetical protein